MKELTQKEFADNMEDIIKKAILCDDFVKIKTKDGKAMLVSEDEWNVMTEFAQLVLSSVK